MDYYSSTFVSSNENGRREVSFEMRRTILDWLLRRPARKHAFVRVLWSDAWHHKDSLKPAGELWDRKCRFTEKYLSSIEWY